jgi:hypothetical protein
MSGMRAKVQGGIERLDVELVPTGMQLCTLYGMVWIGTQETKFGESEQLAMSFEFPQHMRIFTEGGDPKPAAVFSTETFSMNKKANLRKNYVELMHKAMTDDEAEKYDISELIGKSFVATIAHSPDGKWANIQSITPLTEQNKGLFQLSSVQVEQLNNTQYYDNSIGFDSASFGQLPNFLKDKLKSSKEGKEHSLAGGVFAEYVKEGGSTPSAPNSASGKKLEMINVSVPYDAFIAQGWTDETLVSEGHAKWIEAVAPTAPVTPSAPSVPTTPTPPAVPTTPKVPVVKHVPVLVMNDANAVVADWLASGWTQESIISEGHGKLV